jgi:membrane protease YdiL (CAAX protease family)
MREAFILCGFLFAATVFSLIWGRALWYLDERSQAFRRSLFFTMGFIRRTPGEVRALLLTAAYYGLGLTACLLFVFTFGLPASAFISFSAMHLGLAVLGAIGAISLTDLLVDLSCRVTGQGGPSRFAEIQDIPWMKGLRQLPDGLVPVAAALGGVMEELFFRGVVLRILTERFTVAPLLAVLIACALFCLEQLIQVRTAFQAMVIGCGCMAIGTIGGLLVVLTGSVLPAVLCHASFVLFFMTRGGEANAGLAAGKMGAAAR